MENIENGYKGRDTYVLFDSQVVIKALKNFEINYKLVWDCYQSQVKLAEYDRIQLIWVPGHTGIDGNEVADQLVRRGSSCPLIGPEPALSRLPGVGQVRNMRSISSPFMDKSKERALLKHLLLRKLNFSRNQVEIVMGLLTGLRHLKGHVHKLGLVNCPECDVCKQAYEVASHALCDCLTLATSRFRHLDQHFMKPGNLVNRFQQDTALVQSPWLLNA